MPAMEILADNGGLDSVHDLLDIPYVFVHVPVKAGTRQEAKRFPPGIVQVRGHVPGYLSERVNVCLDPEALRRAPLTAKVIHRVSKDTDDCGT
eukprot:CAMPEP_0180521238 /NCGR_PEP_ID=MMETSP1036_2-20121128/56707_1 /TAXON_ID=632150 /ORGANISM="Azadinium spinosum, Strain 3D9" /LENGTH=92 /DNA_ID=CAMNT_0022533815 /DNA_START=204 /DNA_END=482 /DNA_ORIENTATION=+